MQCAFCGRPIKAKSAWKGAGDSFYCGEFCAELGNDRDGANGAGGGAGAQVSHTYIARPSFEPAL